MSTNLISSGTTAREKVNLRTPDVMAAVQQQVESHYLSEIVDKIRRAGGIITVGDTTVRLAKQFGFCYGVERAIDLAYAARKVFKDRRLFIVGEIIHNPEVNQQIASLGIKNLTGNNKQAEISDLQPDDVVIVPAFGTELSILQQGDKFLYPDRMQQCERWGAKLHCLRGLKFQLRACRGHYKKRRNAKKRAVGNEETIQPCGNIDEDFAAPLVDAPSRVSSQATDGPAEKQKETEDPSDDSENRFRRTLRRGSGSRICTPCIQTRSWRGFRRRAIGPRRIRHHRDAKHENHVD